MGEVAGAEFKNWIGDAAVLGLWEVLRNYGYFREQFRQTLSEIQKSKPDAVVLIDYPGFNLRLARALRRQSRTQSLQDGSLVFGFSGACQILLVVFQLPRSQTLVHRKGVAMVRASYVR